MPDCSAVTIAITTPDKWDEALAIALAENPHWDEIDNESHLLHDYDCPWGGTAFEENMLPRFRMYDIGYRLFDSGHYTWDGATQGWEPGMTREGWRHSGVESVAFLTADQAEWLIEHSTSFTDLAQRLRDHFSDDDPSKWVGQNPIGKER